MTEPFVMLTGLFVMLTEPFVIMLTYIGARLMIGALCLVVWSCLSLFESFVPSCSFGLAVWSYLAFFLLWNCLLLLVPFLSFGLPSLVPLFLALFLSIFHVPNSFGA